MCEPVSIVAGGMALYGAISKGQAEKEAADANASALRRNAQLSELAAADARARGEEAASRVVMQGENVKGVQEVAYAGQGVDISSGSAARTVADTATITKMDEVTARNNLQREAWGLDATARNQRAAALDAEAAGQAALVGGIIGGAAAGASSAMSGAAAAGYFKQTSVPTIIDLSSAPNSRIV
jgi:hypothetical protein